MIFLKPKKELLLLAQRNYSDAYRNKKISPQVFKESEKIYEDALEKFIAASPLLQHISNEIRRIAEPHLWDVEYGTLRFSTERLASWKEPLSVMFRGTEVEECCYIFCLERTLFSTGGIGFRFIMCQEELFSWWDHYSNIPNNFVKTSSEVNEVLKGFEKNIKAIPLIRRYYQEREAIMAHERNMPLESFLEWVNKLRPTVISFREKSYLLTFARNI